MVAVPSFLICTPSTSSVSKLDTEEKTPSETRQWIK